MDGTDGCMHAWMCCMHGCLCCMRGAAGVDMQELGVQTRSSTLCPAPCVQHPVSSTLCPARSTTILRVTVSGPELCLRAGALWRWLEELGVQREEAHPVYGKVQEELHKMEAMRCVLCVGSVVVLATLLC